MNNKIRVTNVPNDYCTIDGAPLFLLNFADIIDYKCNKSLAAYVYANRLVIARKQRVYMNPGIVKVLIYTCTC